MRVMPRTWPSMRRSRGKRLSCFGYSAIVGNHREETSSPVVCQVPSQLCDDLWFCREREEEPAEEKREAAEGGDDAELLDAGDGEQIQTAGKEENPDDECEAGVSDERLRRLECCQPTDGQQRQAVNEVVEDSRVVDLLPFRR